MYKYLILLSIVIGTTNVLASDTTTETCANGAGIVIEGKVSGHKYCKSKGGRNWWNAVSWCDAIGRRLIERNDCGCSDAAVSCSGNKCPEFTGIGNYIWAWFMDSKDSSTAYVVDPNGGSMSYFVRNHTDGYSVICY